MTLANEDSRTAELINGDSYLCPWCEAPVLSPQAWQHHEHLLAEDRKRNEEPAREPQPYPADQAAAWNDGGCPSPACLSNMTDGQLAAYRERQESAAARQRDREAVQQLAENRRRERDDLWERMAAEAAEQGACLHCLRKSSWGSGRPRFIRHRIADFHDPARVRTAAPQAEGLS